MGHGDQPKRYEYSIFCSLLLRNNSESSSDGKKNEVAAGEAIFKAGVPAHDVLACISCHGAKGKGNAVIPALAGQHRDSLMVQLRAFSSGARDNPIMHPIAKGMTPKEIKAVASYLASQ